MQHEWTPIALWVDLQPLPTRYLPTASCSALLAKHFRLKQGSHIATLHTRIVRVLSITWTAKCPCCVILLKPKLVLIIFKYSVRTSKRTPNVTITKLNWLMVFKEIIAVYYEKYFKPIYTLCGQNSELFIVKLGNTYSYHKVLKG
jgi:hypothetical protein